MSNSLIYSLISSSKDPELLTYATCGIAHTFESYFSNSSFGMPAFSGLSIAEAIDGSMVNAQAYISKVAALSLSVSLFD